MAAAPLYALLTLLMVALGNAGEYPLHNAAMKDDAASVRSLVASLDDDKRLPALRELDNNQMQPIHIASYHGAGKAIAELARHDASLLEEITSRGNMTALHWAVARAQIGGLEALIKAGANIEAGDDGNKTGLHYAAARGQVEILEALIAAGADTEAKTANGVTPLQLAAEKAQVAAIRALVKAGADVQAAADPVKMSPLHAASYSGHTHAPEAVRALLDAGAKIDAVDHHRRTPLMLAKSAGDEEIIELLQKASDPESTISAPDKDEKDEVKEETKVEATKPKTKDEDKDEDKEEEKVLEEEQDEEREEEEEQDEV